MVLFVLQHLLHPSLIMLHVIFKSFFKKSSYFIQGVQRRPGGASSIGMHTSVTQNEDGYSKKHDFLLDVNSSADGF